MRFIYYIKLINFKYFGIIIYKLPLIFIDIIIHNDETNVVSSLWIIMSIIEIITNINALFI
jgi:hypothetical protein